MQHTFDYYWVNGGQREATNGCKPQVNTGTWLNGQPSTTTTTTTTTSMFQFTHGDTHNHGEGGGVLKYAFALWRERLTRVVRLHG